MHVSKKFHATFLLVLFFNSSLLFSAISHPPSSTRPLSPDSAELFEDFNNSLDVISQAQARIGNEIDEATFKDPTLAKRLTIWREAARNLLENPNPYNKAAVRKALYNQGVAATALFVKPVLDLLEPQQYTAQLLAYWIKVVKDHQDLVDMTSWEQREHFERCTTTLIRLRLECENRKNTKTEDIQNHREEFQNNFRKILAKILTNERAQLLADDPNIPLVFLKEFTRRRRVEELQRTLLNMLNFATKNPEGPFAYGKTLKQKARLLVETPDPVDEEITSKDEPLPQYNFNQEFERFK